MTIQSCAESENKCRREKIHDNFTRLRLKVQNIHQICRYVLILIHVINTFDTLIFNTIVSFKNIIPPL